MSFTVLIGRELPLLICLLQGDFSSLCFVGILTFYALKCFRSEIRLGCIRILVFIKVIRTTNMYIWVLWKFGVFVFTYCIYNTSHARIVVPIYMHTLHSPWP